MEVRTFVATYISENLTNRYEICRKLLVENDATVKEPYIILSITQRLQIISKSAPAFSYQCCVIYDIHFHILRSEIQNFD